MGAACGSGCVPCPLPRAQTWGSTHPTTAGQSERSPQGEQYRAYSSLTASKLTDQSQCGISCIGSHPWAALLGGTTGTSSQKLHCRAAFLFLFSGPSHGSGMAGSCECCSPPSCLRLSSESIHQQGPPAPDQEDVGAHSRATEPSSAAGSLRYSLCSSPVAARSDM